MLCRVLLDVEDNVFGIGVLLVVVVPLANPSKKNAIRNDMPKPYRNDTCQSSLKIKKP